MIGYLRSVFYNVINPYEELLKHGKKITPDDVAIMFRILRRWQLLIYSGFPLIISCVVYALLSMLLLLAAWGKTVLNWAEKRDAEEQAQGDQGADEGRIRL